ncbi:uncharacterized protein [Asterias amurensis]|uniref:uncharacterized protein n=1 Tax=Asterias amurensis TaxID=7602 RepID=UPI003AB5541A
MIWIDVIRMKWRESIHGLLQARDGTQRVSLTGYPTELFDGNPKHSPRSEQQEQELVWNLHPSTRKLHIAFHSLLYNFYNHKDLALPLDLQERIAAMEESQQHGASTSRATTPQTYSGLRPKPTLAAQARHLKLSQLLHVLDKLIVVQEKMFKRLEKQTNLSEWVQDSLKRLFEVLENECDTIVGISVKFSTAKEDRFQMEQDINQITDAFQRILSGFLDVIQSWTDVVGNVRGADVAPPGGEDPWPDQTTIEKLREGLPDGYEVDYDFMEAVLKEAEDEEKWLENGYSDGDETSSGCSDQEEEEEQASSSRPTVDAEIHHEEEGIMQTERDDQPMLEKKTAEEIKSMNNNGSFKKSARNDGYQVLA